MTEEVAAHLEEGGIAVKPYDAMLDDVRKAASSGKKLWTDPAKASFPLESHSVCAFDCQLLE